MAKDQVRAWWPCVSVVRDRMKAMVTTLVPRGDSQHRPLMFVPFIPLTHATLASPALPFAGGLFQDDESPWDIAKEKGHMKLEAILQAGMLKVDRSGTSHVPHVHACAHAHTHTEPHRPSGTTKSTLPKPRLTRSYTGPGKVQGLPQELREIFVVTLSGPCALQAPQGRHAFNQQIALVVNK